MFTGTRHTLIHHIQIKKDGVTIQSNEGLFKSISKGPRLLIINSGGENRFVPRTYAR
jgi:biotin operon repressor